MLKCTLTLDLIYIEQDIISMKTAIYLRVSTIDQLEGYGLEAQQAICEAMAKVNKWKIAHILKDEGISGAKDESERPALSKLLSLAESGKIQAVIVASLDRIGRKTRLVLELTEKLNAAGIKFVSAREKNGKGR